MRLAFEIVTCLVWFVVFTLTLSILGVISLDSQFWWPDGAARPTQYPDPHEHHYNEIYYPWQEIEV